MCGANISFVATIAYIRDIIISGKLLGVKSSSFSKKEMNKYVFMRIQPDKAKK